MRRFCVAVAVALALAGCGEASDYAGLNADSAKEQAMTGVMTEVNERDSPIYHHRMRLVSATRGRSPSGDKAWIVRVADTSGGPRLCVAVWLMSIGIGTAPHTTIDYCSRSR